MWKSTTMPWDGCRRLWREMRSGFECLCDSVFVCMCQKKSSVLKSNSIESIAGWWLRGSSLEVAVGVSQSPFIIDS